jgi:hypothetical protein
VHDAAPLLSENVPTAHGVAAAAPAAENDPAGTEVQAADEVCPVDALNVPAAQGVAEVAPVAATNVPAGAVRHDDLPASG